MRSRVPKREKNTASFTNADTHEQQIYSYTTSLFSIILKKLVIGLIALFMLSYPLDAQDLNSIEGDYLALQDFYKAMDGPNWDNNAGWENMTPQAIGDAFGVVVYGSSHQYAGRVKELNLSGYPIGRVNGRVEEGAPIGNNLTGDSIPESFGNLKKLTHLRLKGNNITAGLDWLPEMTSAVWISLNGSVGYGGQDEIVIHDYTRYNHASKTWKSHNKFEGRLPDFSNLNDLILFEAMSSNLSGPLPDELPPNIQGLFLSNSYLSGELPPAWGEASKLTHLYLSNRDGDEQGAENHYGTIPPEWNGMKEMRWFLLDGNNLSGAIPEFTDWYDLRYFGVNMEGNIDTPFPSWLFTEGKHRNLHTLNLGSNSIWGGYVEPGIRGELPSTQPNEKIHTGLYVFAVPDNSISGRLYQWTVDYNTTQYNVRDNNFTGPFPDLSYAKRLRWVRAENNEFSGKLPEIDPVHFNFQELRFQNNQFSGDIPSIYGQIKSTGGLPFSNLRLDNNLLDGNIPLSIFGKGWNINLSNNKYTPRNLVPIIGQDLSNVTYLPQKPFGIEDTLLVGSSIDLSSFEYPGNSYQWYKDGRPVNGAVSPTIDTGIYGEGSYHLEITHPDINYVFRSESIEMIPNIGESAPALDSSQN